MEDIRDLFVSLIEEHGSADIAEAEFRHMLIDDPALRKLYKAYCREEGTTERRAFQEFFESYSEEEGVVWESLNDYDDIE